MRDGLPASIARFADGSAEAMHPQHLAALLPHFGAATLRRLAAAERLRPALAALAAERHALPPVAPDAFATRARRLALRPAAEVMAVARLCGAAWHAGSIRLCIGGREAAELAAGIGEQARRFALRNAALAIAGPRRLPAAELVGLVVAATGTSLVLWHASLPEGVAERFALKLAPGSVGDDAAGDGPGDPEQTAAVSRIMDRIAEEIGDVDA